MIFLYSILLVFYFSINALCIQDFLNVRRKNLEYISALGLSFAYGAFVGLSTLALPKFLSVALLFLPIYSAIFRFLVHKSSRLAKRQSVSIQLSEYLAGFVGWSLIVLVSGALTLVPISEKSSLPDGPYVYKNWNLPVSNQWASGDMPADNALPYFTAEFLIRKLDLGNIRPIMPGQEIVNRTFAVPFLYLSFRQLGSFDSEKVEIPRFDYVGSSWPDVSVLLNSDSYLLFNAVSFVTNGFLIFVLVFVLSRIRKLYKRGIPAAILLAIFPFFVHQTFYTWTKSFSIAFTVLSLYYLLSKKPLTSGLFLAFAYQVHPMTLIFLISIMIFQIGVEKKLNAKFLVPPLISLFIWQVWTMYIGLNSDLIQQNVASNQSVADHVFARVGSVGALLNPGIFSVYPFNLRNFVNSWNLSGLLLGLFYCLWLAITQREVTQRSPFENKVFQISLISLFFSAIAFSKPVPLQFFGGQLIIIYVLLYAISRIKTFITSFMFISISLISLALWSYQLQVI